MIIWGSTGREIRLGHGEFYCPQCDEEQDYTHIRVARYFTLYFIPLFQIENLGEYIKCDECEQAYEEEVLDYEPPTAAQKMLHSVKGDLASGTPVEMVKRKLLNAGMPAGQVHKAVGLMAGENLRHCETCNLTYVAGVSKCSTCGEKTAAKATGDIWM